MKKLFFIASVGLLFSCNNSGTCVCTTTYTGSDVPPGTTPTTGEVYYEKDAQENCDAYQNNYEQIYNQSNQAYASDGFDFVTTINCVVE